MEKNFVDNISRCFIMIRFNIWHNIVNPTDIELLKLVKHHLEHGGNNSCFIDDIRELSFIHDYSFDNLVLRYESSEVIKVKKHFIKLFNYVIEKAVHLLQEKEFEQACDLIDVFHWYPEAVAQEGKIYYNDLFTRLILLSRKWGTALAKDIYSIMHLKALTRIRIWIKIKILL